MLSAKYLIEKLLKAEKGATAIEYIFIVSFIITLIAIAVGTIGNEIKDIFTHVSELFPE